MRKRKAAKPVFKPYNQGQMKLMPESYDELIPEGHAVRVVNEAVEQLEVDSLLAQYAGGGVCEAGEPVYGREQDRSGFPAKYHRGHNR